MDSFLVAVTDLGDVAVLGAASLVGAIYLATSGNRRAASIILFALLATGLAIGLLKMAFVGCRISVANLAIRSPSGHAAISAAVLGTFASIAATQASGWRRLMPGLAALALVGGIAASRVLLRYHTFDEVVTGLLVGSAFAWLSHRLLRGAPVAPIALWRLGLTVLVVALLLHGQRVPASDWVRLLASRINQHGQVCGPVTSYPGVLPPPAGGAS